MTANEARSLSKTAEEDLIRVAEETIKKEANKGNYEAWILMPSTHRICDRFIQYFKDAGFQITEEQGQNKVLVKW